MKSSLFLGGTMIRGILFDFDGVIVKSMEDHFRGWKQVFSEFGIDLHQEDLYLLEGQGVRSVALQMMRKYGIPDSKLEYIISKKKAIYEKIKNVRIYDGLEPIIHYLAQNGFKLGVVTGGDKKRVVDNLQEFNLFRYFQAIVTEDDVTHTKPDPEPFLKGMQKLDISASECLVIENAPLGIKSAKKAGCYCAAITNTLSAAYLREADFIIRSYDEVIHILKRLNSDMD
jgi:beta-phosphoglucomutase